jgi:hypothetical protein
MLLAGALTVCSAFAKPNFTGSWKLDAANSDFGPMPGPDKMDRSIKHDDPKMVIKTTQSGPQGEMTSEMTYVTDGNEFTNKMRGSDVKGTAKWDGDKLVVNYKLDFQGNEIAIKEIWTMGADGKTMKVASQISAPQGEFERTVAFTKAD